MPEVLELQEVQMSQTGERQTPDPDTARLTLYRGTDEPPLVVELHSDTSLACATPEQLLVGNLNHPHVRLRQPMSVIITKDDALLIARIPEIEEFGYGSHVTAAVEDLRNTLIELFQTLKTEQMRLGPDMVQLWATLQTLIEER